MLFIKQDGTIYSGDMVEGDRPLTEEEAIEFYIKQNKQIQTNNLLKQIDELDIKRIRAIAEPAQKTSTQSWLEYYTEQIQELRQQIQDL